MLKDLFIPRLKGTGFFHEKDRKIIHNLLKYSPIFRKLYRQESLAMIYYTHHAENGTILAKTGRNRKE